MKPIIFFAFACLYATTFSQDTTAIKTSKDTTAQYIKPLLSENKYKYLNPSGPDTVTRNIFLWYPLKNTEDIFNYLPGYYLKYMDVGQVQNLSYNQLDYYNIGVLRHGRPVNDLLDGSIDFNLFSRNEIAEMELTNGFGNFLYNYNNGINIVSRQIFQYRPFSEISFWQDRFQNLYFDGNYHQNILKFFNFNFGITKHSYDGKYNNSDFDKWLGRFNLNYIGSKKFNSFLNVNYSKIQRGLNEGINIDTISSLEKDTLFNENAIVKNPDAYEIRERFDIDLGFILASGRNNDFLTKLQLFTSNSFRKYRDEENRPNPNGIYIKDNSHWIDYGIKLQQIFNIKLLKGIDIVSRLEAEYDKDLTHTNLSSISESERIYFIENLDFSTKYFLIGAFAKTYRLKYVAARFYTDFGARSRLPVKLSKTLSLSFGATYNKTNRLPTYQQQFRSFYMMQKDEQFQLSILFLHDFGSVNCQFYQDRVDYASIENSNLGSITYSGFNANTLLKLAPIDFEINYENRFHQANTLSLAILLADAHPTQPRNSGHILLSYHKILFNNKFELKAGITTRFWSDYYAEFYNGFYNTLDYFYEGSLGAKSLKILANASLDFFIIGKIDKAIFGLTLENILNRLYYTTGVYPNQSRGGLASIISRFNITWYFLN